MDSPADRAPHPATLPASSTLDHLLESLGRAVMYALTSPAGLDVPVNDIWVLDLSEPFAPTPGCLVLAVGLRPDAPDLARVLRAAAVGGAAAVAIKSRGEDLSRVETIANESGVSVVVVPDAVGWRHLNSLLTAAMGVDVQVRGTLNGVASGDLFAFVNALALTVGGAVSIEDQQQHILAYSNIPGQTIDDYRQLGILGRENPTPEAYVDVYRRLWRSPGAIRIPDAGHLPRVAVAIHAGSETLGSIWAIEGQTPLTPDAYQTLEDAARIAALLLLRVRSGDDQQLRAKSSVLYSLIEGHPVDGAATRLEIEPGRLAVIAFQLPSPSHVPINILGAQIGDLVAVYAEMASSQAVSVHVGSLVYTMVRLADQMNRSELLNLATRVVDRSRAGMSTQLRAAVGSTVTTFEEVGRSRREADQALSTLTLWPAPEDGTANPVVGIEHVPSQAVLLELRDVFEANERLLMDEVREMVSHDAEKQTNYCETLLAYLDCFGDIKRASQKVHVHDNTFRYRIRRAEELFGLQLDAPDERLVLWLQLRLRTLRNR